MRYSIWISSIIIVMICVGCANCDLEREANYVNSQRYLPLLESYISADPELKPLYKETLLMGVDQWRKLIQSENSLKK